MSLSTSEAEFVAASQCAQEVLYLRKILRDFHETQLSPTLVYEDNLACITMSENTVRRKYSRQIDIRRYFVRELVADGVLILIPLRTHLMMADALTKSLPTFCSRQTPCCDDGTRTFLCTCLSSSGRLNP